MTLKKLCNSIRIKSYSGQEIYASERNANSATYNRKLANCEVVAQA